MTLTEWIIFFLIVQCIHAAGTWKLYQKAGRQAWEAVIPIYNAIILMKIVNRPGWWTFLLFIPVVNLIMFPVIWVETLRSFGKNTTIDTLLAIVTLGLYIYWINYTQDVSYIENRSLKPKNAVADFISSILFAVVVATTIHTYFIQPFTIPTSSLEKSLLVGDFLFVSKFHYGARTPYTPIAFPMVHDTIPLANKKSYTTFPQLPSFRFPGFETVKKNDIVVFNWPTDTVRFFGDKNSVGIRKPIDKKSNYVKRCVGTPGDSLQIINGDVYVNGALLPMHDRQKVQFRHKIILNQNITRKMIDTYGINEYMLVYNIKKELWDNNMVKNFIFNETDQSYLFEIERDDSEYVKVAGFISDSKKDRLKMDNLQNYLVANLTEEQKTLLKNESFVKEVSRITSNSSRKEIFPHTKNWNEDNMGPLYIPKAGATVILNRETLPFYQMIIEEYEKNDLKVVGDEIRINGQPANSYTFQKDYYWMMGDNRHNSEDSRFWGYVPQDHIVGKPVFIWMSIDRSNGFKIRWERLFTTVGGDGKPTSYFKLFLVLLGIWFVFDHFRKKRKAKKTED